MSIPYCSHCLSLESVNEYFECTFYRMSWHKCFVDGFDIDVCFNPWAHNGRSIVGPCVDDVVCRVSVFKRRRRSELTEEGYSMRYIWNRENRLSYSHLRNEPGDSWYPELGD